MYYRYSVLTLLATHNYKCLVMEGGMPGVPTQDPRKNALGNLKVYVVPETGLAALQGLATSTKSDILSSCHRLEHVLHVFAMEMM